jgi:hypothetical protein
MITVQTHREDIYAPKAFKENVDEIKGGNRW